MNLKIQTAEVMVPLLQPSRYKGAFGGRGSGKSHFFAELGLDHALGYPGDFGEGMRWLCIREVQKSLKESAKHLIEKKMQDFGLGEQQGFKVFNDVIQLPKDGLIVFTGMKDHTADSVKSYEGFHRAWVEEAHSLKAKSLELLRPTIRAGGSELWFSWNPNRPTDPVDKLLRGPNKPANSIVVKCNYSENPRFPAELEEERLESLAKDPDRYPHIWEGEYARVFEGAYYATHIEAAEREGRVSEVRRDPLIQARAYWDIGGTSNKSDATALWVVQFIGEQIRVLNYYEAVGQEFSEHVGWLRLNGYADAEMILPHDGRKHDTVYKATPAGFLRDAGFKVRVMDNLGAGAAIKRVEAARRAFPSIWFNEDTTKGGRDALAWYHERRDEERGIGLGPKHDWASHAADAFGHMACDFIARPPKKSSGALKRNMKGIA